MPTIKEEMFDIQGLILRGYGKFALARFLLVKIVDSAKARSWLNKWRDKVTNAVKAEAIRHQDSHAPTNTAFQIALTYRGLLELDFARGHG